MKVILHVFAVLALMMSSGSHAVDLVVSSEIPTTTNPSPSIEKFLDLVEKRTDGAIKGKYYPASQ